MSQFPVQVQRDFEQALTAGEYAAGDILSLSELSERFEAEPEAMSVVMAAEARKGLVKRKDASSFEICHMPEPDVGSVFVHAQERGLSPSSEVQAVAVEPASEVVADRLRLKPGAPIYRLERIRRVKGEPLAHQVNHMPFEICPGLEKDDVSHASFKRLLERKYLVFLTEAEESFNIVPAGANDRDVLGLSEGASVLSVDRLARSPTGWPVVWAILHIHPGRYTYVAEIWPEAARLLHEQDSAEQT